MTTPFIVLYIFFTIYSSNIVVGGVSGQCLSHQRSLLLQLKHDLIFNATLSKILVKWNESSNEDCCRWPEIRCDGEGHVIGLKLSNESISGGVDNNSTLFNLAHLQSLDLSFNDLMFSTIPSRIGNLSNLSYLNFSSSGFIGLIPTEISRLSRLVTLDFSLKFYCNGTNGICSYLEIPNLRKVFQNLTELEDLYLDDVNIWATGNEWGMAFSSSPNLQVLSLKWCNLYGPIPKSLARLNKSLSVIQLDYNHDLSSEVPEYFANFSKLTSLSMQYCNLYGRFPEEIFQVQTLSSLDLSGNKFLQVSLPEFPMDSRLQSVVLTDTNMGGRGLPASIGNLGRLSTLDVSSCNLSGPLPESIANLTQLVHLELSSNNFKGPIPSFHMSKNLTTIFLSDNLFTGPIPSLIHWEGLLNLVKVDLSNNSLNGNIPSSLFSLPSIEFIYLSNNQFSGQVPEFPNAPSSLLRYIALSNNELQGTIPMSVFNLRKLEGLSLSFNKFNSRIELGNMTQDLAINLYELDLSHNTNLSFVSADDYNSNFSFFPQLDHLYLASCNLRVFPYPIKYLSKLLFLDLSNNQISGMIPSWVWKVSFLNLSHNHLVGMLEPYSLLNVHLLDLSFNQVRGKVPILLSNVEYIDLSNNNFTSSIPSDIGLNLKYLSLSKNSLNGVIPKSICSAKSLKILDLSKNTLSGKIPRCILSMNATLSVNLQENKLRGSIPNAFPINCQLESLDVSGNLLTDRIPKSLVNCRALDLLNVGNNQLVDTFPLFLKNMSTLRVLVLQSNKLYGRITCPNNIGDWPLIQIVSVASNNFSGELPLQCITKWHAMMTGGDDGERPSVIEGDILGIEFRTEFEVRVTNKRLEMEFVKIPKGFTSIDFSSNNFQGKIPTQLGQLKYLMVLNLSNNALIGHIPSSFGNFSHLESLDLSRNHLNGEIPASLSNLNSLEVLDVSHNQLSGRIPTGTQLSTFSPEKFEDNEGLCGPPLTPHCKNDEVDVLPKTPHQSPHDLSPSSGIKWDLISVEVGFIVGFGTVIAPLVFSRRWRKRYYDRVEDTAFKVLPQPLLRKWLSWKMGNRRQRK